MKAAALEDNAWKDDALNVIARLSVTQEFLTADDLRRELRSAPHNNWPGLAFGRAKKLGLIEPVDSTVSKAKSRNHGSLRVWTRKKES